MDLTQQQRGRPGLFLDRDGVLNTDVEYASRPEQITWIPGAFEAVAKANQAGFVVVVITNQSGIARGYFTEQHVCELHEWMRQEFLSRGARIDGFYYCPHLPEAVVPKYKCVCDCRKPEPGMFRQAARDWDINLSCSLAVGDNQRDIDAARSAGIAVALLFTGGNLCDLLCPKLP